MELGIIEGYFGRPWSWAERTATMRFLAPHDYRFFIYAPKADALLRRDWMRLPTPAEATPMATFAADCRSAGVTFGVGLSPFEAWKDFGPGTRARLAAKLRALDDCGVEILALLFDDMRGDLADLAQRQAEIVAEAVAHSRARRIIICPSYYSTDPVLDRVFGQRPADYLDDLGRLLDPAIDVFWTGEEVCSREYGIGHLDQVAAQLRRPPVLWDNYPVNDGERMSQYLHLRGVTGRPKRLEGHIRAHAVNPALQPRLTCVPALTLAASYGQGDDYAYGVATQAALTAVMGETLASLVMADLLAFQDIGLDRLAAPRADRLRARYASIDHPAAREIMAWLNGDYRITTAEVQTQ